jgi:hypothetical protein
MVEKWTSGPLFVVHGSRGGFFGALRDLSSEAVWKSGVKTMILSGLWHVFGFAGIYWAKG